MAAPWQRKHKYASKACVIDGIRFASETEGRRYNDLVMLSRAGQIKDLKVHPAFRVEMNGKWLFTYNADFQYHDMKLGHDIVEDVKRYAGRTPIYALKKKIVEALYGFPIIEV